MHSFCFYRYKCIQFQQSGKVIDLACEFQVEETTFSLKKQILVSSLEEIISDCTNTLLIRKNYLGFLSLIVLQMSDSNDQLNTGIKITTFHWFDFEIILKCFDSGNIKSKKGQCRASWWTMCNSCRGNRQKKRISSARKTFQNNLEVGQCF